MADNNTNNEKNTQPKVRHLEEIFDDVETMDYEPGGSVTPGKSIYKSLSRPQDGDREEAPESPKAPQAPRRRADSSVSSRRPSQPSRSMRSASSASGEGRAAKSAASASAGRTSRSSYGQRSSRPSAADPEAMRSRRQMSPGRARQNAIRRKKKKFKKLLLMYIAALIVILIIGSIIFSIYLGSYENGLPSHVAENIVKSYGSQEGIVEFVTANADKTNIVDNVADTAQVYATNIAGKTISYIENSDFRANEPAYDIIADGSTVAKVTLGHTDNDSKWDITSLNISDFLPNSMAVTVEAPQGSTVTVNSKTLDSSYITSSGVPEILQNSVAFLANPPQYDTYRLSGLVSDPTVSATSSSGDALAITQREEGFIASQPADQEFIDSVEDRVYAAIDSYATYFINMSFDLKNYIALDSDLWSYIFGSDTMDPIATSLYMFEDILSYDFVERSATNYIKYSDDCFTVDVKYALNMVFTDPTYSDDNQKMDATWVFVIDPYDGSWCISDIINH